MSKEKRGVSCEAVTLAIDVVGIEILCVLGEGEAGFVECEVKSVCSRYSRQREARRRG